MNATDLLVKTSKTAFLLKTGMGDDYHYEISKSRMVTERQMEDWIAHLSAKRWFTFEHEMQLMDAFREEAA